jgi:hypothetical protein
MQTTTTVGLDIAKSAFQIHGVDADGNVVFCRQLKRRYVLTSFQKLPSCLVGIEAWASSHYWSRELQAQGIGGSIGSLFRPKMSHTRRSSYIEESDVESRGQPLYRMSHEMAESFIERRERRKS